MNTVMFSYEGRCYSIEYGSHRNLSNIYIYVPRKNSQKLIQNLKNLDGYINVEHIEEDFYEKSFVNFTAIFEEDQLNNAIEYLKNIDAVEI